MAERINLSFFDRYSGIFFGLAAAAAKHGSTDSNLCFQ